MWSTASATTSSADADSLLYIMEIIEIDPLQSLDTLSRSFDQSRHASAPELDNRYAIAQHDGAKEGTGPTKYVDLGRVAALARRDHPKPARSVETEGVWTEVWTRLL